MDEQLSGETVRAIRRVLNDILRKTGAVNAEVAAIFDLLDGVSPAQSAAPAAGGNGAAPAPGVPKVYEVREIDGEERLLETRAGTDAAPFAVPHLVYRAFAKTTAEHSGKKFEAIYRRHPGEEMKDYQGRVCFRFWQSKTLLVNAKGRYAVTGPREEFLRKAESAWEELRAAAGVNVR